jgi:hypothetical protein
MSATNGWAPGKKAINKLDPGMHLELVRHLPNRADGVVCWEAKIVSSKRDYYKVGEKYEIAEEYLVPEVGS